MRFGDRFRSDRERTPDSGEYLEWGGYISVCLSMYVHIRGGAKLEPELDNESTTNLSG
jgi:hypothetical protein